MSSACASCGLCCRSYIVTVCGRDLWNICRHQRLAPLQFVMAVTQPKDRPDGFRLEADGPTHLLVLDKQGTFALDRACVFLVQLGPNHVTCGVYDHRPVTCRAYPFVSRPDGSPTLREAPLCPPGSWAPDEVAQPHWTDTINRSELEFELYGEVVARWNARVASLPGRRFGVDEFCSYLLNVYEAIAAFDATIPEDDMAAIVRSWRALPATGADPAEADMPWFNYAWRIRDILASFYPSVPVSAQV